MLAHRSDCHRCGRHRAGAAAGKPPVRI